MRLWHLYTFLGVSVFLLVCAGITLPHELLLFVFFGWIYFFYAAIPQVPVDWQTVATSGVALIGFIVGTHWFLRWLNAEIQGRRLPMEANAESEAEALAERAPFENWPFKKTLGICAGVLLIFAAGIGMLGIAHQIVWLATMEEPFLASSRQSTDRGQSIYDLRNLGGAILNATISQEALPAGFVSDKSGIAVHGWQTQILPYIERKDLFDGIDHQIPWNSAKNKVFFQQPVDVYLNPYFARKEISVDDAGYALSHYAANQLVIGPQPAKKMAEITDGTSKTILAGEAKENFKPWGSTSNWRDPRLGINQSPDGFGSPWSGEGASMVFADGSVRFISPDVDLQVLKALSSPDGGEEIKDGSY